MGGSAQIWVPPSFMLPPEGSLNGMGYGTPTVGYGNGVQVLTGTSVAAPNNLVAPSPPTLLEEFEIYAVSIAWGIGSVNGTAAETQVTAELQLLVNDRRAASISSAGTVSGTTVSARGRWLADLVNPIRLGARDRLGIRVGLEFVSALTQPAAVLMVGASPTPVAGSALLPAKWQLAESTISYHVLDVPASARL